MILTGLVLIFTVTAPSHQEPPVAAPDYGEVYIEDKEELLLPKYYLETSYTVDLSQSFLNLQGVSANAQTRLWKYFSTGVFFQYLYEQPSAAGKAVERLESVNVETRVPTPHWGVFSLTQFDLFVGRWNLLNQFYVEVDLLVGAGLGLYFERPDRNKESTSNLSYLWSIDQRFQFLENFGVVLGVFGHRGGTYFKSGLCYSF